MTNNTPNTNATVHPTDPPQGANLGGYHHGDVVDMQTFWMLAGRTDFVENWVFLPSEDGAVLQLMWGDACTTEELERVNKWSEFFITEMQAARMPRGLA